MDSVSKVERSRIMRAVRSRENESTEKRVSRLLCENSIRGYRKHWPILGKPDFCWPGPQDRAFRGRMFLAWLYSVLKGTHH